MDSIVGKNSGKTVAICSNSSDACETFVRDMIKVAKKRGPIDQLTSFSSMVVFGLMEKYAFILNEETEDEDCLYFTSSTNKDLSFTRGTHNVYVNVVSDSENFYVYLDMKEKYDHYVLCCLESDVIPSFAIKGAEEINEMIKTMVPVVMKVLNFLSDPIAQLNKAKCTFPKIENKDMWKYTVSTSNVKQNKKQKVQLPAMYTALLKRAEGVNLTDRAKAFGIIIYQLSQYYDCAINISERWPTSENYAGERIDMNYDGRAYILTLLETQTYFVLVIKSRIVVLEGKEFIYLICGKRISKKLLLSFALDSAFEDVCRLNFIAEWLDRIKKHIFALEFSQLSRARSRSSSISVIDTDSSDAE